MIELHILGSQSLVGHDGREVLSILPQPKRFALLCYLATEAGAGYLRRDRLLGLLWPERQEAKARASLSEALSRLRQSLGSDAIVARGNEEVGLAADRVWCDAVEFARAAREGRLEEAAELYRGDLLDGFILSDGADFDAWLEGERARLRRQAVDVVSRLADAAVAAGGESAKRWAERAMELAPLDGVAVRRLMEVEAGLGYTTSALEVYERFRGRLGEERGVEPAAETVELAERIRAGALLPATQRPGRPLAAPVDGQPAAAEAPQGILAPHHPGPESGDAPSRESTTRRRLRLAPALAVVASLGAFGLSLAWADRDPTAGVVGGAPGSNRSPSFPWSISPQIRRAPTSPTG
jgi:serine/threonine-protein kinase